MKRALALAAIAVTAAVAAPSTQAYDNHGWFWGPRFMENTIIQEGLPWMDTNHEVLDATCRGLKPAWRSKGTLLYKSFNCVVDTDMLGDETGYFQAQVHVRAYVLGQYKWTAVRIKVNQ